jgi:hypothetical protein
MYRFRIYNRIEFVCFLKFIVHEMNSEMAKSGMMVLIERKRGLIWLMLIWLWIIIVYCRSAGGREGERKLT